MADETDIQKLAEYAGRFLERKKRGEEEIYTLKDRHPEWVRGMVFKVHEDGHWAPDDYKYEYVVESLDHISEGMDPEEPELEADIYSSDLLKWLSSHRERLGLVDEAVEEHGLDWDKERGIEGMISFGQWYEKDQVFRIVVEALKERLGEIEDGIKETFRTRSGGPEGVLDWMPPE